MTFPAERCGEKMGQYCRLFCRNIRAGVVFIRTKKEATGRQPLLLRKKFIKNIMVLNVYVLYISYITTSLHNLQVVWRKFVEFVYLVNIT